MKIFQQRQRQILCKIVEKDIIEMESVLPLKLKLRYDIRAITKTVKQFDTLMTIVNERKLDVLGEQKQVLVSELEKIEDEHDKKIREGNKQNALTKRLTMKQRTNEMMLELVQREESEASTQLFNFREQNILNQCKPRMDFQQLTTLYNRSISSLESYENSIDAFVSLFGENLCVTQAQMSATKWKLALATSQGSERSKFTNQLPVLVGDTRSETLKTSKRIQELALEIQTHREKATEAVLTIPDTTEHHKNQLAVYARILKLNSEIYSSRKQALECDQDIAEVANIAQLDLTYIDTLKSIESFVGRDNHLQGHYLGPMFQHLDADNDYDYKIWPQLEGLATTILFSHGKVARLAYRKMVESGLKLGSHTFLSVDEFACPAETAPEGDDGIKSAAVLAKHDDPFIEKVLKAMLRFVVLLDEERDIERRSRQHKLIVCSKSLALSKSVGLWSFKKYEKADVSHIDIYQNVYESVKKHVALTKKIDQDTGLKTHLQSMLAQKEADFIETCQLCVDSAASSRFDLSQVAQLLQSKLDLQKLHEQESSLLEALGAIEDVQYDVNELEETERSLQSKLVEDEKQSKLLEQRLRNVGSELEHSIGSMETMLELSKHCSEPLNDAEALVKMYEAEHKKYSEKLAKARREMRNTSVPMIDETIHELELMDIRCRLYEKRSEENVVDRAIKLCERTEDVGTKFDQSIYNQYREESSEIISAEIAQCHQSLRGHRNAIEMRNFTKEQYGHLLDTIKKAKDYAESPEQIIKRNKLTSKTFPLLNKLIVKILKDAVCNYRLSFQSVMEDYIGKSTLYFYTHGLLEKIKEDTFSWESFDLSRLKSLDFLVKWKADRRETISSACLRKIKGLLLVLHAISYLSIFKFIIIDESFFDVSFTTLQDSLSKFYLIFTFRAWTSLS